MEVGCSAPRRRCRCLARCFRRRRHPCPCTDSPSRLRAPDPVFNALALCARRGPHDHRRRLRCFDASFAIATPPSSATAAALCATVAVPLVASFDHPTASHARRLRGLRGMRHLRPRRSTSEGKRPASMAMIRPTSGRTRLDASAGPCLTVDKADEDFDVSEVV